MLKNHMAAQFQMLLGPHQLLPHNARVAGEASVPGVA